MRKTILLLILTSTTAVSQTYDSGALMAEGITFKAQTTIQITKEFVEFIDEKKNTNYDVITSRNGNTYITDGVETHKIFFIKKSGRKKGFKYTEEMYFNAHNGALIIYYVRPK